MAGRWAGRYAPSAEAELSRLAKEPVRLWRQEWVPASPGAAMRVLRWVSTDKTITFDAAEPAAGQGDAPPLLPGPVELDSGAAGANTGTGTGTGTGTPVSNMGLATAAPDAPASGTPSLARPTLPGGSAPTSSAPAAPSAPSAPSASTDLNTSTTTPATAAVTPALDTSPPEGSTPSPTHAHAHGGDESEAMLIDGPLPSRPVGSHDSPAEALPPPAASASAASAAAASAPESSQYTEMPDARPVEAPENFAPVPGLGPLPVHHTTDGPDARSDTTGDQPLSSTGGPTAVEGHQANGPPPLQPPPPSSSSSSSALPPAADDDPTAEQPDRVGACPDQAAAAPPSNEAPPNVAPSHDEPTAGAGSATDSTVQQSVRPEAGAERAPADHPPTVTAALGTDPAEGNDAPSPSGTQQSAA